MHCLKNSRDALKAQDDMLHSLHQAPVLFQETKDSTWCTCGDPANEWTKMMLRLGEVQAPDLTVGHFTRVSSRGSRYEKLVSSFVAPASSSSVVAWCCIC
jgi:hypothetical protein